MSNDSRVRDRIAFQEVARLANAAEPAKPARKDKEDSGMIDLAALAAGDAAHKAGRRSDPDRTPPGGAREEDLWRSSRDEGPQPSNHPSNPPVSSSGVKAKPVLGAAPPATPPPPQWFPSTPTQSTARLIGDPSTAWRPPPSREQPPAEPTSSAAVLQAETTRPISVGTSIDAAPRERRGGTVWIALLGGIGVGALAAVVAFKIHSGGLASWTHAAAPPPEAPKAAAAPPVTVASAPGEWKNADIPGAANTHAPPAVPHAASMPEAPHPGAATGGHAFAGTHEWTSKAVVAAASPPAAVEPAAAPAPPAPKPAPVAAPAPEPTSQDKLVAMMQKAVRTESGPQEPVAPIPAAAPPAAAAPANAGNVPVKPAAGAIMGALGTVMPAARYCLGPDDPVSRATITFKSDGSVENVVITGDAAGQPAESCIKARLMEAKVPPFSSPRFTWTVPVRPAN
ncbi:MAG TPA: hypothetical protein VGM06_07125 [Polyangiaceae bacterium]|jgi:hypothetical protein